ncbi:MAG: pyrroline-5-carboxylate reductase [bacterium]|nr:pyrroline-5-carboxylate reductase [bacterium]
MKNLVGFIGGGQMATALASGAVDAGFLRQEQIAFAEPNPHRQQALSTRFPASLICSQAAELTSSCERLVLAVKPHILKSIAQDLAALINDQQLIISIAAGISLESLQSMLQSQRVIRVMPNTPCQVGVGASAMSVGKSAFPEDVEWTQKLMSSVGIVEEVSDDLIHAVTGIAGSSPAYLYMVIEALSDGGVAQGLARDTATRLAAQAVLGAAKMVLETDLHPGVLKDQVTSPGGTTIAALRKLEACGVRSAFMEAVAAAADRSREMG